MKKNKKIKGLKAKIVECQSTVFNGIDAYPGTTHWEGCWKTGEAKHSACKEAQDEMMRDNKAKQIFVRQDK